jgi:anti-sigma regulatory factor (Ser/Thr protein kinase)
LRRASTRLAERARDVTRGFLSVFAPDGGTESDAVLLVVSELVTNAVRHAEYRASDWEPVRQR